MSKYTNRQRRKNRRLKKKKKITLIQSILDALDNEKRPHHCRTLKAKWTLEISDDLDIMYGTDVHKEMSEVLRKNIVNKNI